MSIQVFRHFGEKRGGRLRRVDRPLFPLIIALIDGNPFWFQIAFWLIAAGIIGAWQPLYLALSTGRRFLPKPWPNE